MSSHTPPPVLNEDDCPGFNRGYRLQHDRVREQWVIQAPERALLADPIAVAILQELDGKTRIGTVIDRLAERYEAPREQIATDVLTLLSDLTEKRILRS
ncbi:pyrroloquinoline quinone biosynthesis peptide chaperone PqqD [Bombella sp. TMW 2.2559]|uniref:Pyrroloquinoline quinone biosynthesis peptide chaperone PqqD n=1 Tax=Bombella dulcis TaxID=2967339 RepID=A0ABT3WE26_9PROT|nr:pyrroloquinoline quinone biosynthesis peptide chaperone PqqD [Bombella dulcis]MCX5616500.1 pyrroloquinoline quinone biosynthesis peptide chaperone PqqD [Bombella dulcis]